MNKKKANQNKLSQNKEKKSPRQGTADLESLLVPLGQALEDILLSSAEPLKEYELIQKLQNPPYELIKADALKTELSLFRTHFLLFYCLYELQASWRAQALFELEIDVLNIQAVPYQAVQAECRQGVQRVDPLAEYYRNWAHLEDTTERDVAELLTGFWQRYMSQENLVEGDLQKALKTLDLQELPQQVGELKKHYYRLVHQHHPDKGGCEATMKNIQLAYQELKATYN